MRGTTFNIVRQLLAQTLAVNSHFRPMVLAT